MLSGRIINQTLDHCRSGWQIHRSCCTSWSKIETLVPAALRLRIISLRLSTLLSVCWLHVSSQRYHTLCLHFLIQTRVSVACVLFRRYKVMLYSIWAFGPELIPMSRQSAHKWLKPGFHYPSWRPEFTAWVDGWPVSITPCWWAHVSTSRVDGPSTWPVNSANGKWRVMETGYPSTWAVNSGSGTRALVINPVVGYHYPQLTCQLQSIAALWPVYQIILLEDRGTCVWTTCPVLLHYSEMAGSPTWDI